jgi:hypothetical protein
MRRRLEARWHKTSKPCDLTATVNDAAVQGKFMSLSGEICLTGDRQITSEALVYKCLGSFEFIDKGERTGWKPIALCRVTGGVIKQKSADGIVAKRSP